TLPMGIIANEICDAARTADLVVIGHRGLNEQFSTGMLGGTTESVARKSPKPVFVSPMRFGDIRRPLLAYDGSQRASAAMHAAAEVTSALGLPLTVIHVVRDGAGGDTKVLAGRPFRGWLAVAPHAEPGDARLERLQAPLDAAHLLLDRRQRRHPLDRAPEALVDESLQRAETIGNLGQLLDAPPGTLGRGTNQLHPTVDGGGEVLERRLAVADDVAQDRQGEETALSPFFLENDLRERDRGEIVAAVVLEDLHFLARLHPAPDLLERDVTALARIVELPISVPLHEPHGPTEDSITARRGGASV